MKLSKMTGNIDLLSVTLFIVVFSSLSCGEGSQQTDTLHFIATPEAVVSAKLGETVTLSCAAKGTPSPDIRWYDQNANLVDPYSVFSSGTELRFPSVSQADVGAYTCIAKNDEGQISFTSNVVITDFLLMTVATHQTDGFKRLLRSTRIYNIPTKVLGFGKPWEGGDMKGPGGGHKVNLLKKALKPFKDDTNKLVMFTDGYDVLVTGSVEDVVNRFHSMDARIVFSAEPNCWPQQALADQYPATESSYKYLNSGGFIGFANDLYDLVSSVAIKNNEDDQLYFTKLFLNKALREKLRMRLDTKAVIFQNLFSSEDDVKLHLDDGDAYLENIKYKTRPLIIHGNGRSKAYMNSISNYLAKSWSVQDGCTACNEDKIVIKNDNSPVVLIGIFITQLTPFIYQFLEKISQLSYSKNKLHLFIYNNVEYHTGTVNQFIENHGKNYLSVKRIESEDGFDEAQARALALELCVKKNCGFFFNVDSVAHLDNVDTLTLLIQRNKGLIGPVLVRPYKAWSNFWGALSPDGFYLRSFDYMDIVNNDKRGVWNIPYITGSYLLNSTLIPSLKNAYKHENLDPDMSFCHTLRNKDIFMFVDNTIDMGHLIDPEFFDTSKVSPDLFQLIYNRWDWEQKYLHPEYAENFNPNKTALQPCPDVYWFPIVSEDFCKELIATVEDFGQWSDGTNYDLRLNGGYENVPTRDIHMNQVGYDASWMQFLKLFVRPLQEHVFTGYFHDDERLDGGYEAVPTRDIHMNQVGLSKLWAYFLQEMVSPLQQLVFIGYSDPPHSLMNFVVRYQPDEQPSLRPHHDSSTYTINLALNKPNIDYQGGGCHFLRYNCSVVDTRMGWLLMHPGRLTHFHEGLKVTGGTRYIMISFVDP